MLLSVSMPVYNAEKHLDKSIASLIHQTFTEYELILVNDGSTDKSLDTCEKWQQKYPQTIRVIDKENEGSLLTRKRCIEESQGEYIYICDADDELIDNMAFEKIVSEIKKTHADIYFFDHVTDNKYRNTFSFEDRELFRDNSLSRIHEMFLTDSSLYPLWNKVFRKDLVDFETDFEDVEDIIYGTDFFQTIPIVTRAKSFVYIKEAFYNYRFENNESSIVHRFNPKSYTSAKKNQKRFEDYVHKANWNVADVDGKLLRMRMIRISTAIYKARLIPKENREERYQYIRSIGEDSFFREAFSTKSVPVSRTIILRMTYYRFYRLLAKLL